MQFGQRNVQAKQAKSQNRWTKWESGEDIMRTRNTALMAAITTGLACVAAFTPLVLSTPVAAQTNPTMTNVIPDGGHFATQGKLQAIDPGAATLTIVPESNSPVTMTVAPGVDLADISVGDVASVHYTRSVTFVVAGPNVSVSHVPATATVEQVAQTLGGIGSDPAVIVGRVVKLNGPNSFDVVNANGGAVYTIKTTNPSREAAIGLLKVGDSVSVSVSPIIATAVAKCGLFGKGLFGC
jgi:hypothetical protein